MINETRRSAIDLARTRALAYAQRADRAYMDPDEGHGGQVEGAMATMWAAVADCMKDGDARRDSTSNVTPIRRGSLHGSIEKD
jgi:hypothetical protein